MKQSINVEEGAPDRYDHIKERISWGPNKTHFIVGYPHQILVWKFDAATSNISLTNTITSEFEINNVALSEDYIIASGEDLKKKLRVWNRSTGDKMVYRRPGPKDRMVTVDVLCDVVIDENDEDDVLYENDYIHPLCLSCHGNILVSTSTTKCTMCIWDIKTGQLLKKYNDPADIASRSSGEWIQDSSDLVYLKYLNGFLYLRGFMNVYSFPTNQRQLDMATSIRQRVATRLEEENGGVESEVESESESD